MFSTIDSLTPTLSWVWDPPYDGPYDIAIYETKGYGWNFGKGILVYSYQNLNGNSHKVDKKLDPDTCYFWTVRKHSENDNGWSNYNYLAFYGLALVYYRNQLFRFSTPLTDKLDETQ